MDGYPLSPTVASVLDEFLQDQQLRLRPRTFFQYENVIDLLRCSLERSTDPMDPELAKAVEKARQEGRDDAICSLCSPSEIASGMPEFLEWFMIRHVAAGPSLMRSANTVARKLTQWLAEHHYLEASDQEALADSVQHDGPLLPKVVAMRDRLANWVDQQTPVHAADAVVTEGHFSVNRVTIEGWKISDMASGVHGVIAVPPQWLDPEQAGWTVSGVVAEQGDQLKWVEIWNIYP